MKFGKNLNKILEWDNYYINYNFLKEIIKDIIKHKQGSEKEFVIELEKEWIKYKNFLDEQIKFLLEKETVVKEDMMEVVKLNDFINSNQEGLRKIVKKHDKNSDYKLYPNWRWKIGYNESKKLFPFLKKVSELYQTNDTGKKLDVDNFNRKSIKYWVRKDKLIPLMLSILENLPIFVWDSEVNDHIFQKIQSVYMDNRECKCYDKRINKEEGARLLRVRWYQDNLDTVFVERKVHHDDWTLEESKKERFRLSGMEIFSYLKGDMDVNSELGREVSDFVREWKLYPKLRTVYNRISFQLPHDNNIRVSLDVDLKMIREKVSHLGWMTEDEKLKEMDVYRFPYSVLEVKLVGDNVDNPPKWIADIMSSDLVIEQPLFSKFIHGSYIFFSNKCSKLPVWIMQNENLFRKDIEKYGIDVDVREEQRSDVVVRTNNCFGRIRRNRYWSFEDEEERVENRDKQVALPLRVEPKTFFANERTYLQWFNAATFVSSVGIAIFSIGENELGGLLLGVASFILLYSTYMYGKRDRALIQHRSTGYNDRFGPYILTVVMMVSYVAALFMNGKNG